MSTDYFFYFWPRARINSYTGRRPLLWSGLSKYCRLWLVSCIVSKFSDFWVCPLILNSHSIRACICLRRKFNNHRNAQHTFAVPYKHLRPALQLLVNFKLLSYLTHMHSIPWLLLLDSILLWTGIIPFKFHLNYLLVWNSSFIGESFIKDLFEK